MVILTIVLIALAAIAIISIVIGIGNWISLSLTSSKIAYLETEIDKKTREFDILKHERLAPSDTMPPKVIASSYDSAPEPVSSGKADDGSQIEIVRNVRSGVTAPDQSVLSRETPMSPAPQVAGQLSQQPSAPPGQQPPAPPGQQPPAPPGQQPPVAPEQQPAGAWNMPIASLGHPSESIAETKPDSDDRAGPYGNALTIQLFSPSARCADYANAWKKLTESLPHMPQPYIVIDFNGLVRLSKQELEYLEQFLEMTLSYGGVLEFRRCNSDVAAVLQGHQGLGPLVQ
jgi:hypothetical protein